MRKVLFILSELADEDVDWLIRNGTKTIYPAGSVLICEGKPIEVLFILLDGQLSVSLAALGGKEIAVLQSGEILGELSFLDSRPPSASVTAMADAAVLSIPRASLLERMSRIRRLTWAVRDVVEHTLVVADVVRPVVADRCRHAQR